MRALVTNDDGVASVGIAVLAGAAVDAGFEVTVAAPSWDSSGASASLTSVEEHGRFLVRDAHIDGFGGPCLAVEAAPAFITMAAVQGAFGAVPEIVLSGVNHGPNTGHAVLHSGTVGAALTAASFGLGAAAFSLNATTTEHWDAVASVLGSVLRWLEGHAPRGAVVNVNVPAIDSASMRGLASARLASTGAVTANVTEVGTGYVTMRYEAPTDEAEPGTDVALLASGYATITTLRPFCEHADVGLEHLLSDEIIQPSGR